MKKPYYRVAFVIRFSYIFDLKDFPWDFALKVIRENREIVATSIPVVIFFHGF